MRPWVTRADLKWASLLLSIVERFIHVPIELLASQVKRLDPASGWWRSVLAATGQPERFE